MEGNRLTVRLIALVFATLVFAGAIVLRLYDLQVVNGVEIARESEKKITRTVVIESARGEILDRHGRKLVTNRTAYNVSFDRTLLPTGDENRVLGDMLDICAEHGIEYAFSLPISITGDTFYYLSSASESTRLSRWLEKLGIEPDISAADVIARMCADYGMNLDDYTDKRRALDILSIRWELDLRSPRIGLGIAAYTFAEDVTAAFVATVKERSLPGVNIDTVSVRKYETPHAAHILGRIGPIPEGWYETLKEEGYALDDTVGVDGAERAFEDYLRGRSGKQVEERNSSGKVTSVVYTVPPDPGDNVILTLDIGLQAALEQSLETRIEEIRRLGEAGSTLGAADVSGGAAVVLDIKTGEILAAASYPTFSLENFRSDYAALLEDPQTPMYNRAFMGRYEPGSTFKMATAAAALQEGVITTRTYVTDLGIYNYYAPSYTPMCEIYLTTRGTHGSIGIVDALRVSCNYFFFEVGRLTGIERLNFYAAAFGFGQPTGVELTESAGTLAGRESREAAGGNWYGGDTLQAAIGQSDNLASPLQLANYVSTLLSGERKQAHLLKAVKTYDYTSTKLNTKPELYDTVELDATTLDAIKRGMLAVSKSGSAYAVFGNYPIDVGSKTGTAQRGQGSANGIFVAFAPYDDPQVAIAVVVEHAGKGSRIGVIARDILDYYFKISGGSDAIIPELTPVN